VERKHSIVVERRHVVAPTDNGALLDLNVHTIINMMDAGPFVALESWSMNNEKTSLPTK
jgi:hypothetical protein